jgi:hypothetical protein
MSLREHVSTFQAVASKLHNVEVDIKIVKRKGDLIDPEPSNRSATRATPKESVKCELSDPIRRNCVWKIDLSWRENGKFPPLLAAIQLSGRKCLLSEPTN